jgi:hypothetical protein
MSDRTVVKTVENAVLYSDGTILVKDVRASYPHVLVARGGTDKDGKPIPPSFSITGLLPRKTHVAAKDLIKARIDEILKENKIPALAADKLFLRNGNLAGKEDYKGMFTVSARETEDRPPSVRDKDGRTKLGPTDKARIYGGAYVNILLRPWWQANKFGKRVNSGVVAVQFLRDGEPFGEGRMSEDDIDETFEDQSSGWENELEDEAADL